MRAGWADLAARMYGGLLVAVATVEVALLESFLVVLRAGTVPLPFSVLIALVAHPVLVWAMWRLTASRRALWLPPVLWLAVVLPLGSPRSEGDVIIPGSPLATVVLLVGAAAFALTVGRLLHRSPPTPGQPAGR